MAAKDWFSKVRVLAVVTEDLLHSLGSHVAAIRIAARLAADGIGSSMPVQVVPPLAVITGERYGVLVEVGAFSDAELTWVRNAARGQVSIDASISQQLFQWDGLGEFAA